MSTTPTPTALRLSQVFVPGKLPDLTYNPRDEFQLEQALNDYVEEAGSILTLSGPTKTGKTVLLRRVLGETSIWIEGQGIAEVDDFWSRVGDELTVYPSIETSTSTSATDSVSGQVEGGLPGMIKANAGGQHSSQEGTTSRLSVMRPMGVAVRQALEQSGRSLVLDDFHFIDRPTQRQLVRALKPIVLKGVPVIFVSISHRVQDVVTAEPDMTGRLNTLTVTFWSEDELLVIARKGFEALNVSDPGDVIATTLAKTSFGSPHLMQQFCRELCKFNGVRERQSQKVQLASPEDWIEFFSSQTDGASKNWFQRLLRGPQERGSARTQWPLKGEQRALDGYGLTLLAIAHTGPSLTISKDEIKAAVDELVDGQGPAAHQTTRVLQHMTKIAAKRLSEPAPTADELDTSSQLDLDPDVQPVLEYEEDGPSSRLHIADPFFAFYLRWGGPTHLELTPSQQQPSLAEADGS